MTVQQVIFGGKNPRGIRVSSYDPDDPSNQLTGHGQQGGHGMGSGATTGSYNGNGAGGHGGSYIAPPTLGSQRKFMPGASVVPQKVSTISQNYNEKTMLLSSDDEYQ
ncbi:hypothetical protein ZHAS_00003109 [Anopheles sinensis]|uniref:Uncharacterized protein n=1 Tax=Anopheles sinensis TaxID=74873 RepID=A0A084VDN4_ANOSI|nr:hypothetical protein ZHAS_00003109 [Anopheles sinensis]